MGEIVAPTPPGKADVPPETSEPSVVSHVLASCLYHYSPWSARSCLFCSASPNTAIFWVSATD